MRRRSVLSRALAAAGLAASLAGCASTVTGQDFAAWEKAALWQGILRDDREAPDAPFTAATLATNFRRTAFGLEAAQNGGRTEGLGLGRWEEPVRWTLFTNGGSEAKPVRDKIERVLDMLAGITGLDIAPAPDKADSNFRIVLLPPEGYDEALASARHAPELASMIRRFRGSRRNPCVGMFYARGEARDGLPRGSDFFGIALIRAGLPDRLRTACIEEELSQLMGLPNDHPRARPSIFNDDQEFQNLTRHDEMLLRILYDSRLRPGLTEDEAMPLVDRIAGELRPGG